MTSTTNNTLKRNRSEFNNYLITEPTTKKPRVGITVPTASSKKELLSKSSSVTESSDITMSSQDLSELEGTSLKRSEKTFDFKAMQESLADCFKKRPL